MTDNATRGVLYSDRSGGELLGSTIGNNGYEEGKEWWQGIAVQGSASPSILNNTVRDNAGVGIHVMHEATGTISGNRVLTNGRNIPSVGPHFGGIAIGFRGDDRRADPTVGPNNTFTNNRGGAINDYR